jgi:hypothetical protein
VDGRSQISEENAAKARRMLDFMSLGGSLDTCSGTVQYKPVLIWW